MDEFKGNSGGQKYNSIVADPQNHQIIDTLPNRYENDLIKNFSQFESKNDCAKAYHNWFSEILNSMDVPWSNGFIEGCNNRTKVLKRVCFGMRNFRNFRN